MSFFVDTELVILSFSELELPTHVRDHGGNPSIPCYIQLNFILHIPDRICCSIDNLPFCNESVIISVLDTFL